MYNKNFLLLLLVLQGVNFIGCAQQFGVKSSDLYKNLLVFPPETIRISLPEVEVLDTSIYSIIEDGLAELKNLKVNNTQIAPIILLQSWVKGKNTCYINLNISNHYFMLDKERYLIDFFGGVFLYRGMYVLVNKSRNMENGTNERCWGRYFKSTGRNISAYTLRFRKNKEIYIDNYSIWMLTTRYKEKASGFKRDLIRFSPPNSWRN